MFRNSCILVNAEHGMNSNTSSVFFLEITNDVPIVYLLLIRCTVLKTQAGAQLAYHINDSDKAIVTVCNYCVSVCV